MTGIELLGRSKMPAAGAKLVLLTAYADTDVAIKAINDIGLDHYLMKPWAPPEERLFPIVDDLLGDWEVENSHRFDGVRVVGNRWSERSYDTRMFLARNHVQYQWLELERDAEALRLQGLFGGDEHELPLVVLPDGTVLHGAGPRDIANALGLRTSAESTLYDLVVIGAGPAGLAAAVYGASEGLRTAVIEREAPGGQAAQSAMIENYLGFPNGLSGADLSPPRRHAGSQARRRDGARSKCRSAATREAACMQCASTTAAKSRHVQSSSRRACRTACWRRRGCAELTGGACSTAPRRAMHRQQQATTSTSSEPPTLPVRPH